MLEEYREKPGFLIREEGIVSVMNKMQQCFNALAEEFPPPEGYTWGLGGTRERRELALFRVDVVED